MNYKLIFIKGNHTASKQINFTKNQLIILLLFFSLTFLALMYFLSGKVIKWVSASEIEKHRLNNEQLLKSVSNSQSKIEELELKIENIEKKDNLLRKFTKLPPIHDDIRKVGVGGFKDDSNSQKSIYNYLLPGSSKIDFDGIDNNLDKLNRKIKLADLSYEQIDNVISTDVEKLVRYPAIHPINFSQAKLTSHYGFRMDPFSHKHTLHEGQDFSGKVGSSVFSTADGVVIKSKYFGSFGNYVEIDHQNGYRTSYGHLSRRHVKVGERVFRGQEIGTLGNTGRSTAPHLHYEVLLDGTQVNPNSVKIPTGEVLAGAELNKFKSTVASYEKQFKKLIGTLKFAFNMTEEADS